MIKGTILISDTIDYKLRGSIVNDGIFCSFRPSETCGPFRGDTSFFVVVSSWVNTFSCVTQQALDFFASPGFAIPALALLL